MLAALAGFTFGAFGCAVGTMDTSLDSSLGGGSSDVAATMDSGPSLDSGTPIPIPGMDALAPGDSASAKDAGMGSETTPLDHGAPDASTFDSSVSDTSAPDSSLPDTSMPECSVLDSSTTCASSGFVGTLATWDLTAEPGNETDAPVSENTCGASASAISRASTITAVAGKGSINGSDWGTAASADSTRYFTFTITPAAGCTLTLTSVALDVKASSTGPTSGDVATSADSFGTHSAAFTGTSKGSTALTATDTGAIEIRVYGYGAKASGGTFRVQNTLSLTGSIH
jgi:hypothetical protein